jgi:hypothetical protein
MYKYRPMLRPAGFATLPADVGWRYVEAPSGFIINRPDLPQSRYLYGIIATDRELTPAELYTFDLRAAP